MSRRSHKQKKDVNDNNNNKSIYDGLMEPLLKVAKETDEGKFDYGTFVNKKYRQIGDTGFEMSRLMGIYYIRKTNDTNDRKLIIFLTPNDLTGFSPPLIIASNNSEKELRDLIVIRGKFFRNESHIVMPDGILKELNTYGELITVLKGLLKNKDQQYQPSDFAPYYELKDALEKLLGEKQLLNINEELSDSDISGKAKKAHELRRKIVDKTNELRQLQEGPDGQGEQQLNPVSEPAAPTDRGMD